MPSGGVHPIAYVNDRLRRGRRNPEAADVISVPRYDVDAKQRRVDITGATTRLTEERVRKDRDSRQPRRRGFDNDRYTPPRDLGFAPRESSLGFERPPAGPTIRATVK